MMETTDGDIDEEEEEEISEFMPPDVPQLAAVGSAENLDDHLQPATCDEEEELDDDGLTHHREGAGELTEVQDDVTGEVELIGEEEPAAEWSPDALDLGACVEDAITLTRIITDGYNERGEDQIQDASCVEVALRKWLATDLPRSVLIHHLEMW